MTWSGAEAAARPPVESHVHDAVDLAGDRVVSTPSEGGPAPADRLAQLRHLGFPGDLSVFGSPSHRLSARVPYQASPEGWLDAYEGSYAAGNDEIAIRQITTLALSFDHRHVDGEKGSRFLADVAGILEDPASALLF